HPGKMVQVGWNAGPRHARIFGLAISYTKKLDKATVVDHDLDTIGTLTLLWSIVKSLLPAETIDGVTAAVGEIGLPKLATHNVSEGTGYRLSVAGKEYCFPLYDRAPCEGLFTQNYSSYVRLYLS
ncbi:hypothetical protein B0H13DRAFT_1621333, partial [Mycena leptocephala]